jgi:cell division protein FtsL
MKQRGRKLRGLLQLLGWLMLLLGSLAVVAWRQTEGIAREQALREAQTERAIAEAERVELERRVRELTSRSRIVRVAGDRLGMRLPTDAEIVLLRNPAEAGAVGESERRR